ncbi:hypothetical protein vB_PsyM_KIL4_0065 [Pseudomonas phage vB_PsyM_KIL4]|uniref:Uncharacterized protein n=2 Tax=Flaumdravirus TaxID=2560133 RepID=A0A142IEY4_9CAUD|nr:hypothetical protein FDI83_gp148 [Pseudomonas phage vB_PsyM_KIL4]AMR57789.1 hypothetical protein vB_PsyM_KIL4_0065 [Pseudomonas phage vB_PsyM_KIL4]AMR57958.1 hypothetical protein vB_PsyM_KIL5_0067 [Pseudomonas phage vB_PsyM_KIL5]
MPVGQRELYTLKLDHLKLSNAQSEALRKTQLIGQPL